MVACHKRFSICHCRDCRVVYKRHAFVSIRVFCLIKATVFNLFQPDILFSRHNPWTSTAVYFQICFLFSATFTKTIRGATTGWDCGDGEINPYHPPVRSTHVSEFGQSQALKGCWRCGVRKGRLYGDTDDDVAGSVLDERTCFYENPVCSVRIYTHI